MTREEIMNGLELIAEQYKYLVSDVAKGALDLLKAQEPRVMTLEEIPDAVFGWIEFKSTGELVPAVLEDVFIDCTVGCATIEDGHDYYDSNNYGKHWRCWTVQPTDAQREAIPWNAVENE